MAYTPHVVVHTTPTRTWVYGPFGDHDAAHHWAAQHLPLTQPHDWRVCRLIHPPRPRSDDHAQAA